VPCNQADTIWSKSTSEVVLTAAAAASRACCSLVSWSSSGRNPVYVGDPRCSQFMAIITLFNYTPHRKASIFLHSHCSSMCLKQTITNYHRVISNSCLREASLRILIRVTSCDVKPKTDCFQGLSHLLHLQRCPHYAQLMLQQQTTGKAAAPWYVLMPRAL